MSELTDRFLVAFGQIETHLHELAQVRDARFSELLSRAARKSAAVRRKEHEIRQFADLRNFLSHRNQRQLAMPTEAIVLRAEAFARVLQAPPLLVDHFSMYVETCEPTTRIGEAAALMYEKSFSQLPVVVDRRIVGLLTSGTIARWVAVKLGDSRLLEEEAVAAVQKHQEHDSRYVIVDRKQSVIDALDIFDRHLHRGNDLDAILITQSGKDTEKLLGILTAADIPRMLSLLND